MGFLKRFANSRIGAGSGDIILEEKDVPESIKREKQALKYTREGYLDVGQSDLSVLSNSGLNSNKPISSFQSPASSWGLSRSSSSSSSSPSPHSGSDHLKLISSRLEDNSTDIYKLMQRIELLERKIERIERLEDTHNTSASLISNSSPSSDNSSAPFPGGLPF